MEKGMNDGSIIFSECINGVLDAGHRDEVEGFSVVGMKYAIPIDAVKSFLQKKCRYRIPKSSVKDLLSGAVSGEKKGGRESMYCTKCGRKLDSSAKFCDRCGEAVNPSKEPMVPPVKREEEFATERKTVYAGAILKCPNCGEVLKAFETVCSICGHEIRGVKGSRTIVEFAERLEKASSDQQRIVIIKNFPIPNTKEDIFEFMLLASSNFDAQYYVTHLDEEDITDAWLVKIEQCYSKAKLIFTDQEDLEKVKILYEKIVANIKSQEIAAQKKHKKEEKKKQNKDRGLFVALGCMFIPIIIMGIIMFVSAGGINFEPDAIKVGISYEEVKGQHYEDIIELFEKRGFTNVESREDGWNLFHKSGEVKAVIIDGKDEFYSFSKFRYDAKIVILYYK